MRPALLTLIMLSSLMVALGQASSSAVEVVKTYSQNGNFYLKTVPFDDEFPTLRGKTSVFATGNEIPLYVFERGFDSVEADSNNLILSDDGETIFYVIPWGANEEKEGLKSVTIYKHGHIIKSFTEAEVTGCDSKKERCSLLYSNYDEVVDREKSNWGTTNYKKVLKEGVSEKERFLSYFPIFSNGDTVYLTDSKKRVHIFDLQEGDLTGADSFDNLFERIKDQARLNRTELTNYNSPIYNLPKLRNGKDTAQALAEYLGMKVYDITERRNERYKFYSLTMDSSVLQDGSLEIEKIEVDDGLPKEKIIEFFKANRFDSSSIPKVFEKWYLGDESFFLRKKSDQIARQERRLQLSEQRQEYQRRLTLESIDGFYIPQNLGECFTELDKVLSEVDRKEMQSLPKRGDMIQYHLSLGMWMRNNWGLHGGSRLQKYFIDKGITDREEMSTIILYFYWDWLNGRKDTWEDWEKNPKSPF